jgi:hypothetical protein
MPWLLAKLAKQQLGSRSLFLIYDGRPGNPFETFDLLLSSPANVVVAVRGRIFSK